MYLGRFANRMTPPSNEFGANGSNPLKWVEIPIAKGFSPFQRTFLD